MKDLRKRLETERDFDTVRRIGLTCVSEIELLSGRLARLTAELAEAKGLSVEELFEQEASAHERALARTKPGGGGSERSPNNPRYDNKEPKPKPPVSGRGEPEQCLLELDEADTVCPSCGGDLERRASLDHSSTLITLSRSFVTEVEVTRCGYGCACGHIEHALPHEDQFLAGGRYSYQFIVATIVLKYWQSMPLNRQVKFFAGHGLEVTTQSLWNNAWKAAELLEPVYKALLVRARSAYVLHADETRWKVRKGKGKDWVWVVGTEDTLAYAVRGGRDHTIAEELIGDFAGVLLTDGMSAYTTALTNINRRRANPELGQTTKPLAPIVRAGCWAHARSYWHKAAADFPAALHVIALINKLFVLSRTLEETDDELRTVWLDSGLAQINEAVRAVKPRPGTSLSAAQTYTLNQWDRLSVFAANRRVPMTNNLVERALRTPVLGRLNFQGAKSQRGSKAAEIFYSLMATCAVNGIPPPEYLDAALRAARQSRVLTPFDYQANLVTS